MSLSDEKVTVEGIQALKDTIVDLRINRYITAYENTRSRDEALTASSFELSLERGYISECVNLDKEFEEQLKSPGVQSQLEVIRRGKRCLICSKLIKRVSKKYWI